MSCNCMRAQPFEVIVNNERKIIYGLDAVVFQVTTLKSENEREIKGKLWEYALWYNEIPETERPLYEISLYDAYLDMKHLFERFI